MYNKVPYLIAAAICILILIIMNIKAIKKNKSYLDKYTAECVDEMRGHIINEVKSIMATIFQTSMESILESSSLSGPNSNLIVLYWSNYKITLYVDWEYRIKFYCNYVTSSYRIVKNKKFIIGNNGDINYEAFYRFFEKFYRESLVKRANEDFDNFVSSMIIESAVRAKSEDYNDAVARQELLSVWDNFDYRVTKKMAENDKNAITALTAYLLYKYPQEFAKHLDIPDEEK